MAGVSAGAGSVGGGASVVGPPPPFDPECGAALEAIAENLPTGATPDNIPVLRDAMTGYTATDEELSRNGRYSLEEPLGMGVVSVEYRLAPEHPHPAPIDD